MYSTAKSQVFHSKIWVVANIEQHRYGSISLQKVIFGQFWSRSLLYLILISLNKSKNTSSFSVSGGERNRLAYQSKIISTRLKMILVMLFMSMLLTSQMYKRTTLVPFISTHGDISQNLKFSVPLFYILI